jgi:hypothetical protein
MKFLGKMNQRKHSQGLGSADRKMSPTQPQAVYYYGCWAGLLVHLVHLEAMNPGARSKTA